MWSGEASLFVQYEEAALLWEQSLTWEKRYTAGPKLVQELSGAARRLVAGQPPGWVAYRGGVRVLMDHLRQGLGKPRVNEVTDLLAAYFKGTRRRAQESMNDYITRKTEAYMRACQALKRVQPHYENPPRASRAQGRRHSGDGAAWSWSRQWTPLSEGGSGQREELSRMTGTTRPRVRRTPLLPPPTATRVLIMIGGHLHGQAGVPPRGRGMQDGAPTEEPGATRTKDLLRQPPTRMSGNRRNSSRSLSKVGTS